MFGRRHMNLRLSRPVLPSQSFAPKLATIGTLDQAHMRQLLSVPRSKIAAGQLVDTHTHPPPARRASTTQKSICATRIARPTPALSVSSKRQQPYACHRILRTAGAFTRSIQPPRPLPSPGSTTLHPPHRPARWLHLAAPRIIKRAA